MHYEIVIAHRVSPALSKTAIGFKTKLDLVQATTHSLAKAIGNVAGRVKLVTILDGCLPDYKRIFVDSFPTGGNVDLEIVSTPSIGNEATFAKQIDILTATENTNFTYFSEDDYLYRTDALTSMIDFMRRSGVDFVTPLDHPDRYNHILEKPRSSKIKVSSNGHWRTVSTSCLTFMTTPDVLRRSQHLLESYAKGALDGTMWIGITKADVFNPAVILRAAWLFALRIKADFGVFMPLCAWKHHGVRLLTTPRFSLWGPMPTLAVHLSDASLPLFAEKFMPYATNSERRQIRSAALRYLELVETHESASDDPV